MVTHNQKLIEAIQVILTVTMLPLGGFLLWFLFGNRGLIPMFYRVPPFKVLTDYILALWITLIVWNPILAFTVLIIVMALISWSVKKGLGSPEDNYTP